jgi:hypothetical protein
MISIRIAEATHFFGEPKAWKPEDGRCTTLAVRKVGDVYESAWEPTPYELAMLVAGGKIVLRVYGGQPPVMLTVEPPPIGMP